ncbi:polysaccharide biosynthesis/export family protein [Saccharicrinis sp. 156]|uniref:polysaccharide biosynthesis/export family protein n=1 Tax=Saccharicrinis sp. 156 TaxID=3417574 RepID=UPI003D333CD1
MQKLNFILFIGLVYLCVVSTSCVSSKKLTYLKYSKHISTEIDEQFGVKSHGQAYKIMPYDNLYISVVTPDPKWSEIFNSVGGEGAITQESAVLQGYPVDNEGNIVIPFVGKVKVQGESLAEIKTKLDSTFSSYVKDASISVRLVNNHVSLIGEVMEPGRYLLTKDRVNIFEALAMAGDMTQYSNRKKVQIIRPTQYGPVIKEFSLSDMSILGSDYYYVMPNDIIYAPPLKGRSFQMNATIYGMVFTMLNTGLVIYTFFRNN